MRKQFAKTMQNILYTDQDAVLLLGDIGVYAFRKELELLPDRVYNIGILEQSMVSLAAGLAKTNFVPFMHTIAPFLVERSLEQIKLDFGYSNLNGNFISVGNSYDYAALGCTHHCPADVQILLTVPNMQIFTPGNSKELDYILQNNYKQNCPKYYRLSEFENEKVCNLTSNPMICKKGKKATVLVFGNMADAVVSACNDLDVTIIYYNIIHPFSVDALLENFNDNIIVCEPFYVGSTNYLINHVLKGRSYKLHNIGVPRIFLEKYGKKNEHDKHLKLDKIGLREEITKCLT